MTTEPCICCHGTENTALFAIGGHPLVRCAGCGLQRLQPQPSDAELQRIYGEHYFDAWGLDREEAPVARVKMATFRSRLAMLPATGTPPRLLDCGAATGFLMTVARDRGWQPYGVEISSFGAERIAAVHGADHVRCGTLQDADFSVLGPHPFAAIVMCDFLEHVRDPAAVLARAHELLAPGGSLLITTPNTRSLSHRLMARSWSHYKAEHLFYFHPENLARLLRAVGFLPVSRGPARKLLNLHYVCSYFEVYTLPVVTPLARITRRWLPRPLLGALFPLLVGEMQMLARKVT